MNDLLDQIQCDEADEPTAADWAEYAEWCTEVDSEEYDEILDIQIYNSYFLKFIQKQT